MWCLRCEQKGFIDQSVTQGESINLSIFLRATFSASSLDESPKNICKRWFFAADSIRFWHFFQQLKTMCSDRIVLSSPFRASSLGDDFFLFYLSPRWNHKKEKRNPRRRRRWKTISKRWTIKVSCYVPRFLSAPSEIMDNIQKDCLMFLRLDEFAIKAIESKNC
jgi:hypothetical protein